MNGYSVLHPLITLEIKIVEIDKLHIHEEIISESSQKLIKAIKIDGHIKHPIIVDKNTLVMLDGTHRLDAMKKMGYPFIPVCFVDYNNPHIVVERWHRIINHSSDINALLSSVNDMSLTIELSSKRTAFKRVEEETSLFAVITRQKSYVAHIPQDGVKKTYETLRELETKLRAQGFTVTYTTDEGVKESLSLRQALAALIPPLITKEKVIAISLSGQILAPKSTRHIIPARPLFINVPLDWLSASLSLKEVNTNLHKHLSKKKLKRFPPGKVLDRRYAEEIYVFED